MTNRKNNDAAIDERDRIRAIIGSDAAKGIETFANFIAFETTLEVDLAIGALESTQRDIANQSTETGEYRPTPFEAMLREAADG